VEGFAKDVKVFAKDCQRVVEISKLNTFQQLIEWTPPRQKNIERDRRGFDSKVFKFLLVTSSKMVAVIELSLVHAMRLLIESFGSRMARFFGCFPDVPLDPASALCSLLTVSLVTLSNRHSVLTCECSLCNVVSDAH
jgi:hypothetical protein